MVSLLKKIYHKLSCFKFIKKMGQIYLNGFPWDNYLAYKRLKKIQSNSKSDIDRKIRVAFIGQNVQIWGKIDPVFIRMSSDDRFDVKLFSIKDINDETNKSYEYFNKLYNNVIEVTPEGDDKLRAFKPDYVFYTRPYDQYLPKQYRSGVVSRYSKVCYCTYTFILTTNNIEDCYSKLFARNVYIYFAENKYMRNRNKKRFKQAHKNGFMKSLFMGYPILGEILKFEKNDADDFSIMWTPRWSTSQETGGSSFFEYKDKIIDYIKSSDDARLIFRPHPLAFPHFIKTGEMSETEVKNYKDYFLLKRFKYDDSAEYGQTFANADVLVSDISSMIPEFYVTKKPIIFCETGAELLPVMRKMLEGCYVSKNWDETEKILDMLKSGEDPLKEKRSAICDEVFGNNLKDIPSRFVNTIVEDYGV